MGSGVRTLFSNVFKNSLHSVGSSIVKMLSKTTKDHLSTRFPGSKHYDPNKVANGMSGVSGDKAVGSVVIDIPGISRAYNNINIYPKKSEYLTIPMHSSAYGKKATDFKDLFPVKDKYALFQRQGSGIVAMFALTKHVFQKQDQTIMPSDNTLANSIRNSYFENLDKNFESSIRTV